MGRALVINLNPNEIECAMCGVTDNQDHPDDRNCVPIFNGSPTTSDSECDGYGAVCSKCYVRWNKWNDRTKQQNGDSNASNN